MSNSVILKLFSKNMHVPVINNSIEWQTNRKKIRIDKEKELL